ncbi:Ti-type conjugative transfer relaxase TraA [Sphingosinicella sp. LHD-64]|uniref:Ti-type conjugative transfer relaxase TraA n=1 Tax=Sphingosinicella sp. LHD-64 TaxID=3072139 RepID=UPI00280FB054|nr:Ti-type conjugative transfer relaxase TraA [Sphingosinicella sp. LHD-64]MDQ8756915.1 Ti-type conjugative transfer relaxase TraA [Sphingosinicella sp. LHD-64]
MAIYHFSVKVISRATGASALASAAYRSASRLHDQRLDRDHDFTNKAGVIHSEVMLPDTAPAEFADRATLWNAVEAAEVRKDAQLAREAEFALPRELDQAEGIRLAREFVAREFVSRGMIADLNIHWDTGADGLAKPHAHVMLTMREVDADGFGAKVRDWNRTELLQHWREAWAAQVNQRLAELDIDARIDHRSLHDQGIDLEPQHKIGPAASRRPDQGLEGERLDEHLEIARRNGERIIADPIIGLDAITHQQSTFTIRDMARLAHRHSEGKEQFDHVLAAMRGCDQLVALGRDGRGEERFTTRGMIETELSMVRAAQRLADRDRHRVPAAFLGGNTAGTRGALPLLSAEQRDAVRHITGKQNLSLVVGYAGTGKSTMLGVAREIWETEGYRVRGAALSGIAAENLESGSGIASRTIASLEHQWTQDRERLSASDVLVIDEAGMIGSRQMERVLAEADSAGAKVVLVGDVAQLQAIEAGAAFRLLAERHGAAEIGEVRRQREEWQRQATRELATGRAAEALRLYEEHGAIRVADTRAHARAGLIESWDADRRSDPARSLVILAHTRDDVRELNDLARDALKRDGTITKESAVRTARGTRLFGAGDRLMFLRNERDLDVKNGTLATVEQASPERIDARLDDGRRVAFDTKHYADIDHGYATTIHKAQGVTVDRTHVLATPGIDQHSAYVALSRHRDAVELHYGQDDFADMRQLARVLGRERAKDTTLDYEEVRARFAETRGYDRSAILEALDHNRFVDERHVHHEPMPKRDMFASLRTHLAREAESQPAARSPFDWLRLNAQPIEPVRAHDEPLSRAVERYAAAHEEVARMKVQSLPALAYQRDGLARAGEALDHVAPGGSSDLAAAFDRNPALATNAAKGRTQAAIRAMQLETELRTNPDLRAARFAESWKRLKAEHDRLGWQNEEAREKVVGRMKALAGRIDKDPAMVNALSRHARDLGLGRHWSPEWRLGAAKDGGIGRDIGDQMHGRSIGQALIDSLGRGRGLSR